MKKGWISPENLSYFPKNPSFLLKFVKSSLTMSDDSLIVKEKDPEEERYYGPRLFHERIPRRRPSL